jgi:hypothetical protein
MEIAANPGDGGVAVGDDDDPVRTILASMRSRRDRR